MRVIIADDDLLLREGLIRVLEGDGIDIVGAAGTADELDEMVDRLLPDLVITDIRMPPTSTDDGLRAALRISRRHPAIALVVLSQYVQRQYAIQLLDERKGGVGYLLKQRIADLHTFTSDLRRVQAGGTALDPEVVAVMVARATRASGAVSRLTPRQLEVLALMAQGRSNAGIASALHLTEKAVVQHTSHIYDAFDLPVDADDHRRVLAVVRFLTAEADIPA